ncbi:MAG: SDR family NAD(P)-dependent oxidoreductase [Phycisphaeraceae bacterium]|nr:SDR family NAD(P)-dependent oxidoreductase [Phycisphaerales bacterium]MCB9861375.1 SDR family NAD(P)-dependent oxidoreductase [Phycisphaeraceae bacterium]
MPSEADFSDRIGVITGASAGIGQALVEQLHAAGARLVINARRRDRLQDIARRLGEDRIAVFAGNAGDQHVIDQMLDSAANRYGRQADLIVANAGRGLRGDVLDSDASVWEDLFHVLTIGAARLMRDGTKRMESLAPTHGNEGEPPKLPRDLVVIGSTVGRNLSPFSSFYGSAKAATHMLTESLRRVAAPKGIRVSLIEPGIVKTEFQGAAGYDPVSFGQFMETISPPLSADDVARSIMFLLSQPPGVHINELMIRPTRQQYP